MKPTNIIKILSLFLLIGFNSFGQSRLNPIDLTKDWKLLTSENGVEFYIRKDVCATSGTKLPFEFSFLKIVNTSDTPKSVSYNYATIFTEACDGCDQNSERSFSFDLPANSMLEGNCEGNRGLSGFIKNPNFDGGWHFESVEIKYLKIK